MLLDNNRNQVFCQKSKFCSPRGQLIKAQLTLLTTQVHDFWLLFYLNISEKSTFWKLYKEGGDYGHQTAFVLKYLLDLVM